MTQGIAPDDAIRAIAAEVQKLTADPGTLAKFRGRVAKYLLYVQRYRMAHHEWTTQPERAVRAAQGDARLTDKDAGPPQPGWVWHFVPEGFTNPDGSVKLNPDGSRPIRHVGAWINPDHGPAPVDPHATPFLVHDYALLAAAHDVYCVGRNPRTSALPIVVEEQIAPDLPALPQGIQRIEWRDFKRDGIEHAPNPAQLAGRLAAAMERVRQDLAPPPVAHAVSIPAAADRMDEAAAALQRFIDTIPMVFPRRVGEFLYGQAGVSPHRAMDPTRATRIVGDAAGKVDAALRALGVLDSYGKALEPQYVGAWREWGYCVAPKECQSEAQEVLDFGKGLHSWDDSLAENWRQARDVRLPANAADWAASAAKVAKSIAQRLRVLGPGSSPASPKPAPTAAPVGPKPLNEKASLSCPDLAQLYNVAVNPLRKRLERWRRTNGQGWMEVQNPGANEADYLYELKAVRGVVEALQLAEAKRGRKPNPPSSTM